MSSATGGHDRDAHHVVQFFDTFESRAVAVARFLEARAVLGDHLLVVAKPEHWVNIRRELDVLGFGTAAAETDGRLVVRDAHATLGGERPLSIYGEMVDVLAERGELAAAVALESMWNALAARGPFTLMCGYASAHFVAPAAGVRLRQVCEAHGHVRTGADDLLGRWLLNTANVPFRDDASGMLA